ncbi:M48 family metallopeptidase [Lutimonas saemankumensis]|uniref:M48 family metallopeptidase n=1 Tax=Lutimonas saemankumensis TaxID=483016 RepID=UPI001CD5D725|nr:M48 family metallopeptidase [Lutimonas saemankumensis]MCA0932140.1 M48 family metallopeptidase [Lutimonas saemankumensis]
MDPKLLFYIIIAILIVSFIVDKIIDYLNAKHFDDEIPKELRDVFNQEEYYKSQAYKKENYRFSLITSSFSILLTLAFFLFKGFAWVDKFARNHGENEIIVALIFFGIIMIGSDILNTPFSFYQTFIIEEKYGFNKSSKRLFLVDKLKGWLLSAIIGGGVLALIIWFYEKTDEMFWIYTWILIGLFTIFMTMFYSSLIVPLFNKQTPLENGNLKEAIQDFSKKVGFKLDNIFVIDGSKRSTKANAYFSGFGAKKRIVLYDTLINDLNNEEIVAVLAHEIGHYKKNHVLFNMFMSLLLTGITLYIFSLFIGNSILSEALSVEVPSFHIGLITFGILYSPISELTGILMNFISRKFEYQADNYAKHFYNGKDLISSLKKLSKNNLSNLTPHKANVFLHYSHPTLLQRVKNLS